MLRLIFNVILRMAYGAVRVKLHNFWIQHMLIYLKTSLTLVWSTVIDKIYLLLIFNKEVLWQNNSVFMKVWDTQTPWPLLYPIGKRFFLILRFKSKLKKTPNLIYITFYYCIDHMIRFAYMVINKTTLHN